MVHPALRMDGIVLLVFTSLYFQLPPVRLQIFSTLRTRTGMVLETLVFSPFNHLTRLVARENFITLIVSRRESSRSYFKFSVSVFFTLGCNVVEFLLLDGNKNES
jgi:hypothetical protein